MSSKKMIFLFLVLSNVMVDGSVCRNHEGMIVTEKDTGQEYTCSTINPSIPVCTREFSVYTASGHPIGFGIEPTDTIGQVCPVSCKDEVTTCASSPVSECQFGLEVTDVNDGNRGDVHEAIAKGLAVAYDLEKERFRLEEGTGEYNVLCNIECYSTSEASDILTRVEDTNKAVVEDACAEELNKAGLENFSVLLLSAPKIVALPVNVAGASAHGDPVIHTFNGECYDLDRDGLYTASAHRNWAHVVKVAVYNYFIREIQITDKEGQIFYSINNMNEETGEWPYGLIHRTRMCNTFSFSECDFSHVQVEFDAQEFKYNVQILYHDYLDEALQEGQRGIHLDIYPVIYEKKKKYFRPAEYEGIYFRNPFPNELHSCSATRN